MSEKLHKGVLSIDGNQLHMGMSFSKVNKEKRTVSGFATLDNVDTQGDIVLAEASAKAFQRARGNLREMHKKDSAVGRIVKFEEKKVFDGGKEYRGIYVTARVSEGAQDTWLKVLDGTLSGFSIGGEINKASNDFNKDAGATVRVVEDYDLTELSLVDNPANQLANVDSFEKNIFTMNKSADGSVKSITGMLVDTQLETVFICKNDETVIIEDADSMECPMCSSNMENAGWFENGPDRTEKVKDIVTKFLSPETEAAPDNANSEGGVEKMGTKDKDNTTVSPNPANIPAGDGEDTQHVADVDDAGADVDETAGTEEVEKAETVEEVHDDESEISKKIDELHEAVKDSLEKSREDTDTRVASLEKKIDEINDAFNKKASELEGRFNEFGEKLETAKQRLAGFEKSLETINSSEALKKSADLDGPAETVQKSKTVWGPGTFSGDSLFK